MTPKLTPIPSAPGYMADLDAGEVWSVKGASPRRLRGGVGRYRYHALMLDGVQTTRLAHRLIAEAAHGPCPAGMECCHINGDRLDNRAANLKWGTHSENNGDDKRRTGTIAVGTRHGLSKLTEAEVVEMRRLYVEEGIGCYRLGKRFGVSVATANRIIRRDMWRHI